MYYDLNVCVDEKKREEALPELYRLGFNVIAFTTRIKGTTQLLAERCPRDNTAKRWVPPELESLTVRV